MTEVQENNDENIDEKPEKSNKKTKSFPNKVVIRKLPPNLTEESFIEMISPLPDLQDLYFCPADWSLGAEATSRAYIEFKNEEDIFIFKDKFDDYVFVDSVRGSEYAAIVEYAPFQGLPKSRARKKDKNVGTIESEQHFLNFLDLMKQEEEADQKNEPKLEYSYQLKDDKKETSTPLIEFLSAKNQEKRDVKRKKLEDRRKQRDDEKKNKKIQIAKNVPAPIKEVKEDAVYEDGIMVRTVPSRLGGRNEKKKDSKGKAESKQTSEDNGGKDQERRDKEQERRDKERERRDKERERRDKDRERREKRENEPKAETNSKSEENADKTDRPEKRENKEKSEREARRKAQKEKQDKRQMDRYVKSLQKPKEPEQKSSSVDPEKPKSAPVEKVPHVKSETKRYSALRKARQEKSIEVKEPSDTPQKQNETQAGEDTQKTEVQDATTVDTEETALKPEKAAAAVDDPKAEARKEARLKKIQERRAREADERAQRQIKNKDRPTLQIYQPKRRQDNDLKSDNLKSSDENSETSRKRSDNDRRRERRSDKKPSRKNSRDETARKKKTSRSEDDTVDKPPSAEDVSKVSEDKKETLEDKFENLALDPSETSKAETASEIPKTEMIKESNDDVQE